MLIIDGNITEVFTNDLNGVIVSKPRGKVERAPCMEVVEFDFDEGLTLAEVFNKQDDQLMAKRYQNIQMLGNEFANGINPLPGKYRYSTLNYYA